MAATRYLSPTAGLGFPSQWRRFRLRQVNPAGWSVEALPELAALALPRVQNTPDVNLAIDSAGFVGYRAAVTTPVLSKPNHDNLDSTGLLRELVLIEWQSLVVLGQIASSLSQLVTLLSPGLPVKFDVTIIKEKI